MTAGSVADVVDVDGITAALDGARTRIAMGVRRQQRAAAADIMAGRPARLTVDEDMDRALVALYRRGVREAQAELRRLGWPVVTRYRLDMTPVGILGRVSVVRGRLQFALGNLGRRMDREAGGGNPLALIAATRSQVAAALERIPGGRSAAAAVVSEAFLAGTADLYRENADAFGGYQATSVLDAGTCPTCQAVDGRVYPTLDAAEAAGWRNGGFGPYAWCDGGPRCRCRIIPLPPGAAQ